MSRTAEKGIRRPSSLKANLHWFDRVYLDGVLLIRASAAVGMP
jgi:hypothetical protein